MTGKRPRGAAVTVYLKGDVAECLRQLARHHKRTLGQQVAVALESWCTPMLPDIKAGRPLLLDIKTPAGR